MLTLSDKFTDLHNKYLDGWIKSEEVIKRTERISNEAHIPAIKEMRYAARRMVQAFDELRQGKSQADIEFHMIEAIENCRKARHDAIDASVSFVHGELDVLVRKAGLDVVANCFAGYADLKKEMNEVNALLVDSRKHRTKMDDSYGRILSNHVDKMVDLYAKLEISRDIIAAVKRRKRVEFWISVIVGGLLIGAAVNIGTTVAEKRGWLDFAKSVKDKP